MLRTALFSLCVPLLFVPALCAAELPDDAKKLAEAHRLEAEKIRNKADDEIKADREKMLAKLTELQEAYTKAGKLDEAVAIREYIKLGGVKLTALPESGRMDPFRGQTGQVLYFEVVGSNTGVCYGTGVYTDDSKLATAAVHAGVLKNGAKGVVKVTIVGAGTNFMGSEKNGVTSSSFTSWDGSYRVEKP